MNPDVEVVAFQLGRAPRGRWETVSRCAFDRPVAIAVAPTLDDGSPFPTTWWLTCPLLVDSVHALESTGACGAWAERIAADTSLAEAVRSSDAAYREIRAGMADGPDRLAGVGTAGQADPLAVKCLHARVAAALAGLSDPVGVAVARKIGAPDCGDDRCGAAVRASG